MTKWDKTFTDVFGNRKCSKCGTVQSPKYNSCISCCEHKNLTMEITTGYSGADDVEFTCKKCGCERSLYVVEHNYRITKK